MDRVGKKNDVWEARRIEQDILGQERKEHTCPLRQTRRLDVEASKAPSKMSVSLAVMVSQIAFHTEAAVVSFSEMSFRESS